MKIYTLLLTALLFSFSLAAQQVNYIGDKSQTFKTGEKIDVLLVDGKVYKATVAAIESDKYQVHFDGYSAGYDVWMVAGQLQRPPVVGGPVEMFGADNKWYKATVLEITGDKYKVRFDGSTASGERWLKRNEFRTVAKAAPVVQPAKPETTTAAGFTVGSAVEIFYGTSWYKGTVLEVKGDQYKVHYDGWSNTFDEWLRSNRLRVPEATAKTGNTASAGAEQSQAAVVKQTYSGTAGKLYLRTYGRVYGSRYSLDINWVFLGADGTIVYDPVSGADPIDYKTEEQNNGNKIGKYQITGKKMLITWRNGKKVEWSIDTKGSELTSMDGGIVTRQDRMPAGYRLAGQYASSAVMPNVAATRTFVFSKDGTFTLNTLGTVTVPEVAGQKEWDTQGTYAITGNTLTLSFANGVKKKSLICIWDMGDGTKNLVINNSYFPQEK